MGNRWKQGTVRVWKTMFQNVSYLGFDLPHQNLQWVQYAWSFTELKGKTAWQGSPPGSRNRLSFWLSFFCVSYWGPRKLSHSSPADSFEWTSPANHAEQHGDSAHLASSAQTNQPKTAETHASCCLSKGSFETSTILDALNVHHTPKSTGRWKDFSCPKTKPAFESWLTVIKQHLFTIYTLLGFQDHSSDCQDL